jgi:triacylglycerol lipase
MEVGRGMLRRDHGLSALVEEPRLSYLPLWHEAFAGVEYLKLKASPVYYGYGVPLGDRSPVIPVPGFLLNDVVLLEMRCWLGRIGYMPFRSHIGFNAECPEILAQRLLGTVVRVSDATGRRVHLIGHSLGGMLARSVAFYVPDKIASIITLASPIWAIRINPFVDHALAFVRDYVSVRTDRPHVDCFSQTCTCGFPDTLRNGVSSKIPQTMVFSKQDGVVDWRTCVNGSPRMDVEVQGSHIGMPWNPQVYRVIGERLARATRSRQHR